MPNSKATVICKKQNSSERILRSKFSKKSEVDESPGTTREPCIYKNFVVCNKNLIDLSPKTNIKTERINDKLTINPQKEEVKRIFGVLNKNIHKNRKDFCNDSFCSPQDSKRLQIMMRLNKHLQMKKESNEQSQSIVFDVDKETFLPMQTSFDNNEMLAGLTEAFEQMNHEN